MKWYKNKNRDSGLTGTNMRWGYLKFKFKHLYTENVVEILVLTSEILQIMSAWKGGVYRNRTSCQRTTFWWANLDSCFYTQRKVSCASKQNSLVNHLSGVCFTLSVIIFSQSCVIEMGICLKSWIWTNSYLSSVKTFSPYIFFKIIAILNFNLHIFVDIYLSGNLVSHTLTHKVLGPFL